jgi:transposase-like protein
MSGRKHSEAERAAILEEMARRRYTPAEAAQRHRVHPGTIHAWMRQRRRASSVRDGNLARSARGDAALLRAEVRTVIREMLPAVLHEEFVHMVKTLARSFTRKRRPRTEERKRARRRRRR